MRAITLTQPWATLVASGAKRIETRSWSTVYRGPLAIHAAKGLAGMTPREFVRLCWSEPFRSALARAGYRLPSNLPRGVVVATCVLVDCIRVPVEPRRELVRLLDSGESATAQLLPPAEPERSFGDYTPGRYAWLLTDATPLPDPIRARGSLGLWKWDVLP